MVATMAESQLPRTSYDDIPYGAATHPTTHPDRLATIATLFGATPPPVAKGRVLELGCARGMNLLPMAVELPDARLLGIDLSAVQIEDGQRVVDRLGLGNIELRHASILDIDESYGRFDYVICHGVFAWVPHEVQQKILRICAEQLTENGVAQISYNTYPGWHLRGLVREMLLYHSSGVEDPTLRTAAARALLDFLAGAAGAHTPYGRILNEERALLARLPDYYVFHEHLESNNQPMYFHEFAGRAAAFGLQYLGDADPPTMGHFNFPGNVQEVLRRLSGSVVQAEQYMDFLRNRMFRQSLLMRDGVRLSRTVQPDVLRALSVASPVTVDETADVAADEIRFVARQTKETLTTKDPLLRQALLRLGAVWPASLPYDDLVVDVGAGLGIEREGVGASLAPSLLRLYLSSRLLELHVAPPGFVTVPGDRPAGSALARFQAEGSSDVTNLRHESVRLDDIERLVLRQLDGTRSRETLLADLLTLVDMGVLTVGKGDDVRGRLEARLDVALQRLAGGALLVSPPG
jgi:methyltransferase-like protein/2-polyprenyl-3-methyl-5-hydroxy-6-metoxy-1,4-benzoquinol methylase